MTEKEKSKLGVWYDANFDEELLKDREKTSDLCIEYTSLKSFQKNRKREIIENLFCSVGKNVNIMSPFRCDYGYNIKLGDNVFINYNCVILDSADVIFGNNVFVGPNCSFVCAIHPLDFEDRNRGLEKALPIHIGNNVWIASNVTILPNVTIGDSCVIGAGSVVTKDIPSGYLAFGNPARPIRYIEQKKSH